MTTRPGTSTGRHQVPVDRAGCTGSPRLTEDQLHGNGSQGKEDEMPVIRAIHEDTIPWQRSEAKQADGRVAAVSHKKFRAEGHPAEVVLVDWGAGFRGEAHSHEAD